jgi:maltooligosyltrehalose trehalohydrolase
VAEPDVQARLPVPYHRSTFEGCKLDWSDRDRNPQLYRLHWDLIRLRQADPRFSKLIRGGVDGAVLGDRSFVLRYFADRPNEQRLLIVNFGEQHLFSPAPEPLLAPPDAHEWKAIWTSEAAQYGGIGMLPITNDLGWTIPAEAAIALSAVPATAPRKKPKKR